jgi:hypothetical protein
LNMAPVTGGISRLLHAELAELPQPPQATKQASATIRAITRKKSSGP